LPVQNRCGFVSGAIPTRGMADGYLIIIDFS
jgi:hypothetical protein